MKKVFGTVGYLDGMSNDVFMKEWRKSEDVNMKWKLIKFLAKLNLKTACQSTGLYCEDGTAFQATS